MKRVLFVVMVVVAAAGPAFAQRKTEAEERERFNKLLEYAGTQDVPSRRSVHEECVKFGSWIEDELLGRLSGASIQERQVFWTILYERGCRRALAPALAMLPEAIERCRQAQIAVWEIRTLRVKQRKAEREGKAAEADDFGRQADALRHNVPWNEIVQGDEVAVLCAMVTDWGREKELKKMVDIAIASSTDDALGRGELDDHTRTHRDATLPGGTEMWNTVYNPVWEGLRLLAKRGIDPKARTAEKTRLTRHFEKFEKAKLSPNQEVALAHYHAVIEALSKTEKDREEGEDAGDKKDDKDKKDDGVGIIKM